PLLSMHLSPPRPPLFPYTTLFRSQPPGRRRYGSPRQDSASSPLGAPMLPLRLFFQHRELDLFLHRINPIHHHPHALAETVCLPRDRKSIRLNSSHQIISYAVFCLI